MNSNFLFVPIELKAMVVNDEARKGQHFERWAMNYHNLSSYQSPVPAPFSGGTANTWNNEPEANGVYLHWTLPDALRKGTQNGANATVAFPFVPNRWLVLRYSGPLSARKATAWVVESDYIDPNEGTVPFLDPFAHSPQITHIGRKVDLANWQEQGNPSLFLTAVGPGDITFAAYQPYVENVFSIHDPLTDVDNQDTLSYMVMGWYADPEKDIVKSQSLQELSWRVSGDKQEQQADQSIYHGLQHGIVWDKEGSIPESKNPSAGTQVVAAVGNNSIDALTALIYQQAKAQGQEVNTQLLEAFQYNLLPQLDEPNGQELLYQAIHKAWFSSLPGGHGYVIVKKPTAADKDQPTEKPSDWSDPNLQPSWLAQLNKGQQDYDEAVRKLQALQWQLYSLWWTQGRFDNLSPNQQRALEEQDSSFTKDNFQRQLDPSQQDSLASQVRQQQDTVSGLLQNIPHGTTQQELQEAIEQYATRQGLSQEYELKKINRSPFHEANNPVVLLAGAKATDPLTRDQPLPCRFTDQLITGFHYDGQVIDAAKMQDSIPSIKDTSQLPTCAVQLIHEFFFLDPNNATLIAANALGETASETVKAIREVITQHQEAAFTGTLPALNLAAWQQPWAPLFLAWEVLYYPISYDTAGQPNWTFDRQDYTWTGQGGKTEPITLTGRIFLTPQCSFNFRKRLQEYKDKHPGLDAKALQNLEDFISKTDQWDFLSQSLDGFMQQIALRDVASNVVPHEQGLKDLIGGQTSYVPNLGYTPYPCNKWPSSSFQPYRAGQFAFRRLMVIDRFGQSIEVVNSDTSLKFAPTIAADMHPGMNPAEPDQPLTVIPDEPYRFIELKPRLLQPARLNFDFVSNTDDSKVIDLHADSNPVCAWLLPNHLDRAISCYDNQGQALGAMRIITNPQASQEVHWEAAPNGPYPRLEDLQTPFPHLYQFLTALQAKGQQAFANLFQTIDEALWAIDPLGARDDQNLSVLIGRPLALTRARLQFELNGQPISDPSWQYVFNPQSPDFIQDSFPIQLGALVLRHDGLIGYFLGEDYNQFNAAHMPASGTTKPIDQPYIKPIGPDNFIPLKFQKDCAAYVTMLIDPRASVHATMGILPTKILDLPTRFVNPALAKLAVTFHVGPLLSSTQTTQVQNESITNLLMPVPAEKQGTWKWISKQGDYILKPSDQQARFSDNPYKLCTGQMQLALHKDMKK